jgi:hypothetical protein
MQESLGYPVGHHLLTHEGKSLAIPDFDLSLVRHFLIRAAILLDKRILKQQVEEWEYQGPGTWTNIDEATLVGESELFDVAKEVVRSLGNDVPVKYLNQEVTLPGGSWTASQSTVDIIARLESIKRHLETGA